MKNSYRSMRILAVAVHLLASAAVTPSAHALTNGVVLPAPAVSRALDAVLIPIDAVVAKEFALADRTGVLVLAVQPGGVADSQGIKPGDVLIEILGRPVRKPIDVDIAVRRGLQAGTTGYAFDVHRGGTVLAVATVITLALYEETFTVSEISSWSSWSESTSFSYSEFVSEYAETIEASYESEESTIEAAMSSEETSEATDEDADGDGTADAQDADDDDDGTPDDADADDDNDGTDDGADDGGAAPDDGGDAADDSAADDGGDDASADEGDDGGEADDGGGDDSGGDDGAADDGGE